MANGKLEATRALKSLNDEAGALGFVTPKFYVGQKVRVFGWVGVVRKVYYATKAVPAQWFYQIGYNKNHIVREDLLSRVL